MLQNNDAPSGQMPGMAARVFLAGAQDLKELPEQPMAAMHQAVMLEQALAGLALQAGARILDATFGRGGHSVAILAQIGAAGQLFAIDRDPEAAAASQRLADDSRFNFRQCAFSRITKAACDWNVAGSLQGILFDLGVSSPQLDDAARGFSFMSSGPLDMRMDPGIGDSAADFIANAEEREIADVLFRYGEERRSRRIARAIVRARAHQPVITTEQLVDVIRGAVGRGDPNKHPATRTFQALRIKVNDELGELESALQQSLDLLASGGRLVVISFHSLEDRLVKNFMRSQARSAQVVRGMPFEIPGEPARLLYTGRSERAPQDEVVANPRSRSAIMRVAERI